MQNVKFLSSPVILMPSGSLPTQRTCRSISRNGEDDIFFWYDEGFGDDFVGDRHLRPPEGNSSWVGLSPQTEFGGRVAFDKPRFDATGINISTGHGPEITIGRTFRTSLSEQFAIIKYASLGSAVGHRGEPDWNVGSVDELLDGMITEVDVAINALQETYGETGRVAAIFWAQDSDPFFGLANSYERNLGDLISATRAEWGEETPFVMTRVHKDIIGTGFISQRDLDTVRAAQDNLAALSDLTILIDMDDVTLGTDSLHYDSVGTQIMGSRFADAYLSLVPEPSAAILAGLGVGGLLLMRRRG